MRREESNLVTQAQSRPYAKYMPNDNPSTSPDRNSPYLLAVSLPFLPRVGVASPLVPLLESRFDFKIVLILATTLLRPFFSCSGADGPASVAELMTMALFLIIGSVCLGCVGMTVVAFADMKSMYDGIVVVLLLLLVVECVCCCQCDSVPSPWDQKVR